MHTDKHVRLFMYISFSCTAISTQPKEKTTTKKLTSKYLQMKTRTNTKSSTSMTISTGLIH